MSKLLKIWLIAGTLFLNTWCNTKADSTEQISHHQNEYKNRVTHNISYKMTPHKVSNINEFFNLLNKNLIFGKNALMYFDKNTFEEKVIYGEIKEKNEISNISLCTMKFNDFFSKNTYNLLDNKKCIGKINIGKAFSEIANNKIVVLELR